MIKSIPVIVILCIFISCKNQNVDQENGLVQVSGIYPHLAFYNEEGSECGVGAVVPWSGRLWAITYGASNPFGSSDKLYEITPELNQIIRPESNGGTHANRMIHIESNQLFMGYYAIDTNRNVRVIPYDQMPGRLTGNARHLFFPNEKIYYGAMEGGFYEVDVNTLDVNVLYKDASLAYDYAPPSVKELNSRLSDIPRGWDELKGDHGKGMYSGQRVLVYSNNGERAVGKPLETDAGSLSEWNGNEWILIRRNQFCDVTGPGGIYGNENPDTDPIWATGWDHKSLLVGVRNHETGWHFYRLPKASYTYDGLHGHFTEWPRIRDVGTPGNPEFLMTMHGMFWHFPGGFTHSNSAGIRPRSAFLKVTGDFTRWNDQLVFGCDDSPHREFNNKRLAKGSSQGPGQSNSNLWFTPMDRPDHLGPTTASGAVWLDDNVVAGEPSDPFLFTGWKSRSVWINNGGDSPVTFSFEMDKNGSDVWSDFRSVDVKPSESIFVTFGSESEGEWVRLKTNKNTIATATFNYTGEEKRSFKSNNIFSGLSKITDHQSIGGLLYGLGDDRRSLGIAVQDFQDKVPAEIGYYELDEKLNLVKMEDPEAYLFIKDNFTIPKGVIEKAVQIRESSVLIIDDKGQRWRLPLGNEAYTNITNAATLRIDREVVTERDLFNCHGTFYELPAESADGYAKIRPIASHDFRINDYASYRGLLVMTGIAPDAKAGEHIVRSGDGKAAVWVGAIDDLWQLGKPTGHGGPWKNTEVNAGEPSDPFLIGFYDKRSLEISHKGKRPVAFSIEVEPIGQDPWLLYKQVSVQPNETFKYEFPPDFQARWIRFVTDESCISTALLDYK